MSGRHLLVAAAIAAATSLASIGTASAGCYSCGASYSYAAPVAYYSAPVVYSYSYAAPAAYASSCGCGGGYAVSAPSYIVNQGPAYTAPVVGYADPEPAYAAPAPSYGYGSAYPSYSQGGYGWHRRWHRGYRNYGGRWGYRGYGYRHFGVNRYRYGAVVPGARFGMRHPMGGMGGMHRGPNHPMVGHGMHHGPRHAGGGMAPGFVHPRMGGQGPMQGAPKKKMP